MSRLNAVATLRTTTLTARGSIFRQNSALLNFVWFSELRAIIYLHNTHIYIFIIIIIYNKPNKIINNYKYALHVSDALCVRNM